MGRRKTMNHTFMAWKTWMLIGTSPLPAALYHLMHEQQNPKNGSHKSASAVTGTAAVGNPRLGGIRLRRAGPVGSGCGQGRGRGRGGIWLLVRMAVNYRACDLDSTHQHCYSEVLPFWTRSPGLR